MSKPPHRVGLGEQRPPEHEGAVATAIGWLVERHRKGWTNAVTVTLDAFAPGGKLDLAKLDEDAAQAILINVGEWLLARGEIHARGGLRNINEYLLGARGPPLSPGQARWIAQLRERPLRLYRVTDVRAGDGLTLVDALDPATAPVEVRERSGSRTMSPGTVFGARLMVAGDHVELSGAMYAFGPLHEAALVGALSTGRADPGALQQVRTPGELTIARRWLTQFTEPPPMPELRDAATGDRLLLVTDHYRVLDAAALAAALAAQPDVDGDASAGWSRSCRVDDAGDGAKRSLLTINPGTSPERVELFARTQHLADEGRAWFEAVAGAAVRHLTREIVDPRSQQALAAAAKRPATAPEIDPQQLGELIGQALRRSYADWADQPIPVLGGQTPRQAIATPAGLERVKGLLRQYEAGEAERAHAERRGEISFQFLWDALGIAR